MISLTTFITLLAHFNDLKRRVDHDSSGFCFGGVWGRGGVDGGCLCFFRE